MLITSGSILTCVQSNDLEQVCYGDSANLPLSHFQPSSSVAFCAAGPSSSIPCHSIIPAICHRPMVTDSLPVICHCFLATPPRPAILQCNVLSSSTICWLLLWSSAVAPSDHLSARQPWTVPAPSPSPPRTRFPLWPTPSWQREAPSSKMTDGPASSSNELFLPGEVLQRPPLGWRTRQP